jgi:hypothetical protein
MKNIIRNVFGVGIVICCVMQGHTQAQGLRENNGSVMFAENNLGTSAVSENNAVDVSLSGKASKEEGDEVPRVILGVRYMPTFTSLNYHKTDEGVIETTFVLGYGIGGLLGFNITDNVGLQGEVIYSSLAQKYKSSSTDIEHKVQLSYVNVPLLLVFNTGYSHPVNLNICVGPQIGINTGSKIETNGTNQGDTLHAVLAVKPADLGIAYGAGLDFGPPNFKISVGFRGVYGLLDISDNNTSLKTDQYYILDRAHVKTYSGYIGVTFGF